MEIHKIEENEKHISQCHSNKSFEKQKEAWEESKQKYIKNCNYIEKLLKECEKDLLDEDDDDEVYSNSESEEW